MAHSGLQNYYCLMNCRLNFLNIACQMGGVDGNAPKHSNVMGDKRLKLGGAGS